MICEAWIPLVVESKREDYPSALKRWFLASNLLKDLAERLPPGAYVADSIGPAYLPNVLKPNGIHCPGTNGEGHARAESISGSSLASFAFESSLFNKTEVTGTYATNPYQQNRVLGPSFDGTNEYPNVILANGGVLQATSSSILDTANDRNSGPLQDGDSGSGSRNAVLAVNTNQIEAEWIEQYEPGVYITLMALSDGTRDLKRVRFSRRRFGEHQAETWWSENREKVYERYNVCSSTEKSSSQAARGAEGAVSPVS